MEIRQARITGYQWNSAPFVGYSQRWPRGHRGDARSERNAGPGSPVKSGNNSGASARLKRSTDPSRQTMSPLRFERTRFEIPERRRPVLRTIPE